MAHKGGLEDEELHVVGVTFYMMFLETFQHCYENAVVVNPCFCIVWTAAWNNDINGDTDYGKAL